MVQVQWFPGHMAKTRRLITENIKLVDVVLELADARVPESRTSGTVMPRKSRGRVY